MLFSPCTYLISNIFYENGSPYDQIFETQISQMKVNFISFLNVNLAPSKALLSTSIWALLSRSSKLLP